MVKGSWIINLYTRQMTIKLFLTTCLYNNLLLNDHNYLFFYLNNNCIYKDDTIKCICEDCTTIHCIDWTLISPFIHIRTDVSDKICTVKWKWFLSLLFYELQRISNIICNILNVWFWYLANSLGLIYSPWWDILWSN